MTRLRLEEGTFLVGNTSNTLDSIWYSGSGTVTTSIRFNQQQSRSTTGESSRLGQQGTYI